MRLTCTLAECPPGLFLFGGCLGFRSEYGTDAYVVSSGEAFWGGAKTKEERDALMVTPVEITDPSALRLVDVPANQ